jgi:hypothetical protein
MKKFISILLTFILSFLILSCSQDNSVDPVSPNTDDQSTSLSKRFTRLNFTGTESLDAVSDPTRILDPGTVVIKGNKIIITGFTILDDITVNVEGMGSMSGNTKIVINAVWDAETYTGHTFGTFTKIFDGVEAWQGVFNGHRSKIGENEWVENLKFRAVGLGDNEGMTMKGNGSLISPMPIPLIFSGPIEGKIIIPNP